MIRSLLRYTHHLTGAIIISFLIGLVAELTKVVVLVLAAMMLFDPQNASHLLIPGIIAVVIVGLGSFGEQYAAILWRFTSWPNCAVRFIENWCSWRLLNLIAKAAASCLN